MKNARQILIKSGPVALGISMTMIILDILIRRFTQNSLRALWLDESIMVFIANHTPFTPAFFVALKENIAGMPWPFLEYAAYLRLLEITLPLPLVMDHLESIMRFPLTVYSALTISSMFLMAKRLSKSWMIGSMVALCLFSLNYLSKHLGGELRFHSSAMAHIALSWCLLSYFLTQKKSHPKRRIFYLIAWLLELTLTGWSHLYGIYSAVLQGIVLGLAGTRLFSLPCPFEKQPRAKITVLIFIITTTISQTVFFLKWPPHPYSRQYGHHIDLSEAFAKAWQITDQLIFYPSLLFWIISLIALGAVALRREKFGRQIAKKSFMIFLGLLQIGITLSLGTAYFQLNWGPEDWGARYAMCGLAPFAFFYSLNARNAVSRTLDQKGCLGLSLALIFMYLSNPILKSVYGSATHERTGQTYQKNLRYDLRRLGAHGRITTVLGLQPIARHLDQKTIHGTSMDFTWQLYVKGPFAMTPITEYQKNLFGGLRGVSCAFRDIYPVVQEKPAEEYVIDFCDKEQYILRIFKPRNLPST